LFGLEKQSDYDFVNNIDPKEVCLLDLNAKDVLAPSDAS